MMHYNGRRVVKTSFGLIELRMIIITIVATFGGFALMEGMFYLIWKVIGRV